MRAFATIFFLGATLFGSILLGPTLPVLAEDGDASDPEPSFWAGEDERLFQYERTMMHGDELLISAAQRGSQVLARRAIAAYEAAIVAQPLRPEPHYRIGETLDAFFISGAVAPRAELQLAVRNWREFERKAPLDPRMEHVLFSRSIALTKLGGQSNWNAAVLDYDSQLYLIDQASEHQRDKMGRVLSNRAEILMMQGKLGEAIAGYEQALKYQRDPVYGYGLAVALDRDGQGKRAREIAREHALRDSGNSLERSGTFFVPPGEKFYYIAIKQEGLGKYQLAVHAYREFLRLWPSSPWGPRARENLKSALSLAAKQSPEDIFKAPPKRVFHR